MSTDMARAEQLRRSVKRHTPRQTVGRVVFDAAFGIALPLVCLYFDPVVFRATFGKPLLGSYFVVGGLAIGLGLLSLSTWLLFRRPPALLAGLLAGGAIFAGLLGLVLLPLSLLGLVVGIGVLGFLPFVTAFVFWRNAVHAYRQAREVGTPAGVVILAAIGLAVSCGEPWAAQWYVTHETSRAFEMALSHDPAEAAQGAATLRLFRGFVDMDRLVLAYAAETDPERRIRLAEVFRDITGADIKLRLAALWD